MKIIMGDSYSQSDGFAESLSTSPPRGGELVEPAEGFIRRVTFLNFGGYSENFLTLTILYKLKVN